MKLSKNIYGNWMERVIIVANVNFNIPQLQARFKMFILEYRLLKTSLSSGNIIRNFR